MIELWVVGGWGMNIITDGTIQQESYTTATTTDNRQQTTIATYDIHRKEDLTNQPFLTLLV
jgi:hypothetical protein